MSGRTKTELVEQGALLISGPRVLRTEQVQALVASPDCRRLRGKRDAALLAVLVGGGLRVGEAVRLTVANVQSSSAGRLRLTFRTAKARDIRFRTVTLPVWAATPLSKWLDYKRPSTWLFEGYCSKHLSVAGAEKIVDRYLGLIGRSDLH